MRIILLVLVFICRFQIPSAIASPIETNTRNIVHILNRLSFGPAPGDVERVRRMGIENFIHQQLYPDTIPESGGLMTKLHKFTTLGQSPAQLLRQWGPSTFARPASDTSRKADIQRLGKAHVITNEAAQARLMRAVESSRQLQEVMVDFWFNHFNIFKEKDWDIYWLPAFEEQAIRPHVLGSFSDLLKATATHPAMMVYLDNWKNTAPSNPRLRKGNYGLNENYARELMELHTLGVNGGYSQNDVIALARILTGWGVHRYFLNDKQKAFYFSARSHDFSPKILLGHPIDGYGINEGMQALDFLANYPATAHHLCFQLAQYFLSDSPNPALVQQLSDRFLETKGDIRQVLDLLFHSQQFWSPANFNNKFKTPYQYVISCLRASGDKIDNYGPAVGDIAGMGMPIYGCLTPDGYKNTREEWLSPHLLLTYLSFAVPLARGNFPVSVNPKAPHQPLHAVSLISTLGGQLSAKTQAVVAKAVSDLQAALVLGSPEFVQR